MITVTITGTGFGLACALGVLLWLGLLGLLAGGTWGAVAALRSLLRALMQMIAGEAIDSAIISIESQAWARYLGSVRKEFAGRIARI